MSRVLDRALRPADAPAPVRPRLPALFEPGLDLMRVAAGPEAAFRPRDSRGKGSSRQPRSMERIVVAPAGRPGRSGRRGAGREACAPEDQPDVRCSRPRPAQHEAAGLSGPPGERDGPGGAPVRWPTGAWRRRARRCRARRCRARPGGGAVVACGGRGGMVAGNDRPAGARRRGGHPGRGGAGVLAGAACGLAGAGFGARPGPGHDGPARPAPPGTAAAGRRAPAAPRGLRARRRPARRR